MCDLHKSAAVCQCLYHREPICDVCKYNQHKDCPKDTVPVNAKISDSDPDIKKAHNDCCKIYDTAREICNGNLSHENNQTAKDVKFILNDVLKELKSKAGYLLKDVESYINETNSNSNEKYNNVKEDSKHILTQIGDLMKDMFGDIEDSSTLKQRSIHFQEIVHKKVMEKRKCDLKALLTLELARLLQQERVVTLPQAIRSSNLIDCLYPPVKNAIFEPEILDIELQPQSKSEPLITGCTILRTGIIVLVDKAHYSMKLYKDNDMLKEIKFAAEPFDTTEKEGNLYVTFPTNCKIHMITDPEGNDTKKALISTETKCYGIEYGGGKLVVACHVSNIWQWSRSWVFRLYGDDNKLVQIVEKDKLGHPFYLTDGYFDFCPLRDEILYLMNDGTATRFYLTGPSLLESLGEMGPKHGETLTAIRSSGNMKITCHTENYSSYLPVRFAGKTILRLRGSRSSQICEIPFDGNFVGPIYFDIRSRKLVVCEKKKSNTCYMYTILKTGS